MTKINLEKILDKYDFFDPKNEKGFKKEVLKSMKDACRQSLELASENIFERRYSDGNIEYFVQSKNSTIDTINEIE